MNEYTSINGGGFQVPNPSYDDILLRQGYGGQDGSAAAWNFSSLVSSSLVSCVSTTDIRHVHYDAILLRQGYGGQDGNVIALTNSTGNISARYRYSPFGELISSEDLDSSGWNDRNLHRFSTKPEVAGTGLLYYGYRWYDPATGRWPSRDPIEESGGMNIYVFVLNKPILRIDKHGLFTIDVPEDYKPNGGVIDVQWDIETDSADPNFEDLTSNCSPPKIKKRSCVYEVARDAGSKYNKLIPPLPPVSADPAAWVNYQLQLEKYKRELMDLNKTIKAAIEACPCVWKCLDDYNNDPEINIFTSEFDVLIMEVLIKQEK